LIIKVSKVVWERVGRVLKVGTALQQLRNAFQRLGLSSPGVGIEFLV
jgi:hypothetical protein